MSKTRRDRRIWVAVCCNDDRNGMFLGRVTAMRICFPPAPGKKGGWELEFDHDDFKDGAAFTVDVAKGRFTLHHLKVPFIAHREWVGNWCWDEYSVPRDAALQLLRRMGSKGVWHLQAGPVHACRWFEKLAVPA